MMLGFPPPLFFQICWRFVSPAIIFVSSQGSSLLLLPLGQVSSWEPAEREHTYSSALGMRGLDSQTCAHSEGPGRSCLRLGGDMEPFD